MKFPKVEKHEEGIWSEIYNCHTGKMDERGFFKLHVNWKDDQGKHGYEVNFNGRKLTTLFKDSETGKLVGLALVERVAKELLKTVKTERERIAKEKFEKDQGKLL